LECSADPKPGEAKAKKEKAGGLVREGVSIGLLGCEKKIGGVGRRWFRLLRKHNKTQGGNGNAGHVKRSSSGGDGEERGPELT